MLQSSSFQIMILHLQLTRKSLILCTFYSFFFSCHLQEILVGRSIALPKLCMVSLAAWKIRLLLKLWMGYVSKMSKVIYRNWVKSISFIIHLADIMVQPQRKPSDCVKTPITIIKKNRCAALTLSQLRHIESILTILNTWLTSAFSHSTNMSVIGYTALQRWIQRWRRCSWHAVGLRN